MEEEEEQENNRAVLHFDTFFTIFYLTFNINFGSTDNKYRLPACADYRADVYEKEGSYMVYHFALEHDDYYMNYGVFANGLLVETCSKRNLKELSNMEIIE